MKVFYLCLIMLLGLRHETASKDFNCPERLSKEAQPLKGQSGLLYFMRYATTFLGIDLYLSDIPVSNVHWLIFRNEFWKDIPNFEGLYMASYLGRIKALEKKRPMGRYKHIVKTYPEKIMKSRPTSRGYPVIGLSKNPGVKYFTVHRLVSMTFHPNPSNFPCINHKDNNKLNPAANNLEWCTHKYNTEHAMKIGVFNTLFSIHQDNPSSREVINTETKEIYKTLKEAMKFTKYNKSYTQFRREIRSINNNTKCMLV